MIEMCNDKFPVVKYSLSVQSDLTWKLYYRKQHLVFSPDRLAPEHLSSGSMLLEMMTNARQCARKEVGMFSKGGNLELHRLAS